MHAQDSSTAQH